MYDVSNPKDLTLVGSISLGSLPQAANGPMVFHNGHLFFYKYSYLAEGILVYKIAADNTATFVGKSPRFGDTLTHLYFPQEGVMLGCGRGLTFWDISDLTNITQISSYSFADFLWGFTPQGDLQCAGVAFHPNEPYFLIAINNAH